MTAREYIEKIEEIRKRDLMTYVEIARELNLNYMTLYKRRREPERCSRLTIKKLKKFVDEWYVKNTAEIK